MGITVPSVLLGVFELKFIVQEIPLKAIPCFTRAQWSAHFWPLFGRAAPGLREQLLSHGTGAREQPRVAFLPCVLRTPPPLAHRNPPRAGALRPSSFPGTFPSSSRLSHCTPRPIGSILSSFSLHCMPLLLLHFPFFTSH